MTVRLADDEISKLEHEGRLIRCVAVVCRVCGFRQHDHPNMVRPQHERCPMGCVLSTKRDECRLCGDSISSASTACNTHSGGNYYLFSSGHFPTRIADTHWHAADRTGPVTQYAVT